MECTKEKLDRLGNWSWHEFKEEFRKIWYPYEKYGEVVLNVELEELVDVYKDCFLKATCEWRFLEMLKIIWTEKYHHVISSMEELINYCNSYYNGEGFKGYIWLYPEISEKDLKNGEIIGTNQPYSIDKNLFVEISSKINKNGDIYILDSKQNMYVILFIKNPSARTYGTLKIAPVNNIIFIDN